MLQMFLQQFVPAMEQVLTLAVPLGILFAILRRLPLEKYRRNYNTAIHWGFWLSVAIVAARVGTRNAVSREVAEAGAIAIAMVAEIVLIAVLVRGAGQKEKLSRPLQVAACAIGALLFFYHGMEIWLIPVGTIISAAGDYMTQAVAVKLAGFAAGLFFGIVSSYVTYKAAAALNPKRLLFVFIIQAAAMFIQQGIFLVQVLMARHILDSAALLSLMAPIIDHSSWLIFIIFFALLFVPLTLFSQKKPARPADANPAQYRRMLMQAMHETLGYGDGAVPRGHGLSVELRRELCEPQGRACARCSRHGVGRLRRRGSLGGQRRTSASLRLSDGERSDGALHRDFEGRQFLRRRA